MNPVNDYVAWKCGNCGRVFAGRYRDLGGLIGEYVEHMKSTHPGSWHPPSTMILKMPDR